MTGDFFLFLDADDQIPPKSISKRLMVFKENPELDFIDGSVEIWNCNFNKLLDTKNHKFQGNPRNALLNLDESVFFGLSWMIRRKPGFTYSFNENITHGEDLLFYISISDQGLYEAVDNVVYRYRRGIKGNAMSNLSGLERGYRQLISEIKSIEGVTEEQVSILNAKTKNIMFKSYLASFHIIKAIRVAKYGCQD